MMTLDQPRIEDYSKQVEIESNNEEFFGRGRKLEGKEENTKRRNINMEPSNKRKKIWNRLDQQRE